MKSAMLIKIDNNNNGIAKEWAFCAFSGVQRSAHDHTPYDKGSDCGNASVKSSGFTLMAGSLCEGRDTFDGIWNLYESRVHSTEFVYVTNDFTAYIMTLVEFKLFVYTFCKLERESEKNGGALKIRCRKESGKMLRWLADMAAA